MKYSKLLDAIKNCSSKEFSKKMAAKMLLDNLNTATGVKPGDHFVEANGTIGVLIGPDSSGVALWGTMIADGAYRHVKPVRKVRPLR